MPKCSVGDLAVVTSAHHSSNLGRIVRILRSQAESDPRRFPSSRGAVWYIRSVGNSRLTWSDKSSGKVWRRLRGLVPDDCLTPIRGISRAKDAREACDIEQSAGALNPSQLIYQA